MVVNFVGNYQNGYVGEISETPIYVGEVMRYNMEMRNMPRGEDHYNWKGGKRSDGRGYIKIYKPDHPFNNRGSVLEHRLIIEKTIGRYLQPDEIVHHINGTKDDNRIENLQLMSRSEHNGYHALGNRYMAGRKLSERTRLKISEAHKNYWKTHSPSVNVKCTNCGKEITRQPYRLKRSSHHFCSFGCYKKHGTGTTVWL